MKNKTGVQEWAPNSFNCVLGCANNCRYCYAKKIKKDRFKLTDDWEKEKFLNKYKAAQKKYNGIVMFPTAHDINEENYDHFVNHLFDLIGMGNQVLIVSKMPLNVAIKFITSIGVDIPRCCVSQIEFRITINCLGDNVKKYWEPNSPKIEDRIMALRLLIGYFKCSISVEPLLEDRVIHGLISSFAPLNMNIWIGCLTNYKLNLDIPEEKEVIKLYKTLPEIYEEYRKYDFIKFKDSFFKAMNRELKRRKKLPKFSFCSADNPKLNGRNIDTVVLDD